MAAETDSPITALAGVRVVEIGDSIASAYACKLLVDLGADVTKIEVPDANASGGIAAPSQALRDHLDRGKRRITLDPHDEPERERWRDEFLASDILVESLGPGGLEARSLDLNALRESGAETKLAVVRISPFGQTGPYRDRVVSSLVLQAAGGWAARIGTPEGPPYYVGGDIEQFVAGAFAAAATLSAHRDARANEKPIEVDVSIFECIVGTVPYPMLQKITFDRLGFPVPQRYQPIPGIMPCRDGYVGISALTGQHWSDVCSLIGIPELGEKMREVTLRGAEWNQFVAVASPWLGARDAEEIVETFQAMRVPAVPIGSGENLPRIEPFKTRAFYARENADGPIAPRSPFRFSTMGVAKTPTVAAKRGCIGAESSPRDWGGGRPGLPLSGVRVLDLTTFWAGPYLTMYLASMGADVIKVESPKRPDGFRFVAAFPDLGERWWEQSGVFHATNLGKRGLTLDLDQAAGKNILLCLAADADVVAENFSPRVIEHFGLDYSALRDVNPGIIMVRMPGFGLSGPCRDWVGWALTFEQLAGCAEMTGEENGRRFAPGGFADPAVGMHAAFAVQAALLERERTGVGRQIEISQVETVAAMTAEQVIQHSLTGKRLSRTGNRSAAAAPQGIYPALGTDEWIAITVRNHAEWQAFCRVVEREDWEKADELATVAGRRQRHDEIDREIAKFSSTRPAREIERLLGAVGVPTARLMRTADFYSDPQLVAREHFVELGHPVTGTLAYPRWPLRFSSGPADPYASGAPTLGAHNRNILSSVLGLGESEIEELSRARVIGDSLA